MALRRFAVRQKRSVRMFAAPRCERVNAGLMEIVDGFATEEFAADFVMGVAFFLDQSDGSACSGEAEGDHGAGGTAADDEVVDEAAAVMGVCSSSCGISAGDAKARGLEAWMTTSPSVRPAAAHMRCQSSGTKARAMETGPSC